MSSSDSLAVDVPLTSATAAQSPRTALRMRLLADRSRHAADGHAAEAAQTLTEQLRHVVQQLAPDCLGLYWPVRSEFNALPAFAADPVAKALPFTQKQPPMLRYRRWDGVTPPTACDDANILVSEGAETVPDVVLVPCVGYTAAGYRLGYGGGYFDRFMAAHPHVTAVGVAWSFQLLEASEFTPDVHDRPLAVVVTERGVA